MLFGVHLNEKAEDIYAKYPKAHVIRRFHPHEIKPQNLIPHLTKLCKDDWSLGLTVAVSFKFDVENVMNGKWKPHIDQAVAWLTQNDRIGHTLFIIWHEPENDFSSAKQYVEYFNKVHGWVKRVNPKLITVHSALGYRYRDGGEINDDKAREWGGTTADIKCIDMYSGRNSPLDAILPETSAFKRWRAHTVRTSQWGVTERGWSVFLPSLSTTRAATIGREIHWLTTTPEGQECKLYIMWLTNGGENDDTLLPDSLMERAVNSAFDELSKPPAKPKPPATPQTNCPLCLSTGKVPKGKTYVIVKAE